jgi:hypothetical protein
VNIKLYSENVKGIRPLEMSWHGRDYNIKKYPKEIGRGYVDWIPMGQNRF